jgi:hypothetical protein
MTITSNKRNNINREMLWEYGIFVMRFKKNGKESSPALKGKI